MSAKFPRGGGGGGGGSRTFFSSKSIMIRINSMGGGGGSRTFFSSKSKALIRLFRQEQSDQGLHCLPGAFTQVTSF